MENNNQNIIKPISSLNKELDIDIVKTVLRKNWYIIPITLIIGLSICFVYLRYTKPIYQSSAIIQRTSKDEGKRILQIESFEQEFNLSEDVELLRSTFLLEKAVKNLNLKVSYFSEGKILTEEKYLQSPYHVTFLELKDSTLIGKPIYVKNVDNKIELIIKVDGAEKVVKLTPGELIDNDFFSLTFKINDKERFYNDVVANNLYFIFNDYSTLTKRLHQNLNVFVVNAEAKTIQVSFKS